MCRRVQCSECGRPTYAGCGAHIEQVLRDVAPSERCRCRQEKGTAETPAQTKDATRMKRAEES